MRQLITNNKKDPLGTMIWDHYNGDIKAALRVESTTLDMWEMSGQVMFRNFSQMNRIERKALGLCQGKILDVGAGSGCHSRYLQKKNQSVTAIDISPGCVKTMNEQQISHVLHQNLFTVKGKRFDTVLMLMNGLGICGTIDGLNLFFQFIPDILAPGAQILADSTDLSVLYETDMPSSLPGDVSEGKYFGETRFTMSYKGIISDPFDWIYIDYNTLEYYAGFYGFSCEKLLGDRTGKYLARIQSPNNRFQD